MGKLLGPIVVVVAAIVGWFYLFPDTVPAQVSPDAVNAGRQAGQQAVDVGQHFYQNPMFWTYACCGGAAALVIMFWRNIGQKAKIIVSVAIAIVLTVIVMGGRHR